MLSWTFFNLDSDKKRLQNKKITVRNMKALLGAVNLSHQATRNPNKQGGGTKQTAQFLKWLRELLCCG